MSNRKIQIKHSNLKKFIEDSMDSIGGILYADEEKISEWVGLNKLA